LTIQLTCATDAELLGINQLIPTDVEIFLPKSVEKKNPTGNCIM
jgi:hypothetical protein